MRKLLLYCLPLFLLLSVSGCSQVSASPSAANGEVSVFLRVANIQQVNGSEASSLEHKEIVGSGRTITIHNFFHSAAVFTTLFVGAVALLAFFVIILFFRSRESIYVYYFLFLIGSLAAALINLQSYDWQRSVFLTLSPLANRTLEAVTLLALFAYCLFSIKLLDIHRQAPRLSRWIMALAMLTFIYGCVYWFIYPYVFEKEELLFIISRIVILIMSFVAIIWVSYRIRSVFKSYFIIGSAFYFGGAFLAVLRGTSPHIPFSYFYNIKSTVYFHAGIFLEIICFALALSHRVYLLYKAREMEKEAIRKKAVYERDLAQAQVLTARIRSNPHFIFNSLNAIKYLVQSGQNHKALKSLNHYSRFIRTILQTITQPVIPLSRELDIIRNYLLLESSRYDRDFLYKIDIQPQINTEEVYLPPLLLLPFIEEAIWQSRQQDKEEKKELSLEIKKEDARILITIEGQETPAKNDERPFYPMLRKSAGEEMNLERLTLHNKNREEKIFCYIKEKKNREGKKIGNRVLIFIEKKTERKIKTVF